MKYYGKPNTKKGIKVGEILGSEFDNKNSAIGIIREHGLLGEYVSRIDNGNGDTVEIDTDPKNISMNSVEYNGNKYWYGENSYDIEMQLKLNKRIGFYRELPDIYDDAVFHWKKNKKYGSLECVIEEGIFEYQCIYKPDGNANINVRYVACDNLHRNKVTMSTIEVINATNDVIIEAIKKWKSQFKDMLQNA